jgi:hypothetical protein
MSRTGAEIDLEGGGDSYQRCCVAPELLTT